MGREGCWSRHFPDFFLNFSRRAPVFFVEKLRRSLNRIGGVL
jgi:hypothetical protein